LWPNEQSKSCGTRSQSEKDVSADEIGLFEDDPLQNVHQTEQTRSQCHRHDHAAEVHFFGEEHQKAAAGEQTKSNDLPACEWLIEQEIANHCSRHRTKAANCRKRLAGLSALQRVEASE